MLSGIDPDVVIWFIQQISAVITFRIVSLIWPEVHPILSQLGLWWASIISLHLSEICITLSYSQICYKKDYLRKALREELQVYNPAPFSRNLKICGCFNKQGINSHVVVAVTVYKIHVIGLNTIGWKSLIQCRFCKYFHK